MSETLGIVSVAPIGGGFAGKMGGYSEDGINYDEMYSEMGDGSEASFKPMTSAPFVFGIMGGVLLISIGLGILFAKLKIKKGLNVYED